MTKLLKKRKSLPPPQINVYRNQEYEKALEHGKVEAYKVNFQIESRILFCL